MGIVIINPDKSKEFEEFVKRNVKTKEFWDKVKEKASTEIDKEEIEKLMQ